MDMRRIVAGVLTVALMGGLLWSGLRRPSARPGAGPGRADAPDPVEARLNRLLDDALRGDVSSYLDDFSGPLRARLEREADERGRSTFAADLRRTARARKSHAIFAVEPEGEGAARITVEAVYPDRNERQTYHLTRESGGWLVDDVETVRSQVPRARFGTVASYQEPEGVPVQGLAAQGVPLRVEADAGGNVDPSDDGTTRTPAPNP
jgi:hypothetical protein